MYEPWPKTTRGPINYRMLAFRDNPRLSNASYLPVIAPVVAFT
jgi:hypothetical protein